MNISVLCPTRGRPASMVRLLESIKKTADNADKVELMFYIDEDDDASFNEAQKMDDTVGIVVGPKIILSETWNKLADKAQADILMQCGDDAVFRGYHWDTRVMKEFDKVPDKIVLVHGNDLASGDKLATLGFLHRKWVEVVGYFLPPYFKYNFTDTWITEVANKLNRKVYLEDMIIEHLHFSFGKAPIDPTYDQYLKEPNRTYWDSLYDKMWPERERDVIKLQHHIEDFAKGLVK